MEDQKAEASGQEMGLGVPTMKSAKEQDVTAYRLIVMSEMATMLLDKAPTYRPKKAVPAIQMAQDFELAGDNVWLLSSTGVAGDYLVQKEDGMLMAMPRQEFEDSFRPTKRPATTE